MIDLSADVLIIGAGAAGLAAAATLARGTRSVIVLEARDRIGGRCYTRHNPGLSTPIELGAEFIHGRSRPIFTILKKAGLAALDAKGPHWFAANGELRPRPDLLPEIKRAMRRAHALLHQDVSFEEFLARELRHKLSAAALAYARALVAGYDSADPMRISALEVVEEWTAGGGADSPLFRPQGGYGALLAFLADGSVNKQVRLQLQSIVKTVTWKRGRVKVTGAFLGAPFIVESSHAIITLPLGVLRLPRSSPHAVHFFPALKEQRAALRHIDPGATIKLALRFHKAFWEQRDGGRYRNVSFFHAAGAAFPTFWTSLPSRTPLLVAWIGGPRARHLAARAPAEMTRLAIASLGSIFGKPAEIFDQLASATMHNWQRDPYCYGTYSYITTGGQGARETLARPLRDTLYFAGEATDLSGEAATVGGALQSGIRAARALMRQR